MRKSKVIAVVLIVAMALQMFALTSSAKAVTELDSNIPFVAVYKAGSYGEYLQTYARAISSDSVINIDVSKYTAGEKLEVKTYEGKDNVLVTQEGGYVEFTVDVPATGLYGLGCDYFPTEGKGVTIERSIKINGETPYNEAKTAALDRLFVDDVDWDKVTGPDADGIYTGYFPEDLQGNQVRLNATEKRIWIENSYFKDSTGSYDGVLQFYLEKGPNVIRLDATREPVAFSELYLYGVKDSVSYTEFLAENNGLRKDGDRLIAKIQGEYPDAKSSTSVYSGYDRSSAATQPQSSSLLRYNVIGGENWNAAGQWVEYRVNVEEAGLYKITLRARQNIVSGTFSNRKITVNGETPVIEASKIQFAYSSDWQMVTPTDDYGNELLFKFNKGENVIRIAATTGELSEYINAVETVVSKLNNDYRKILQITGPSPDEFRDYKLDEEIPEVISDLKAQGDILTSIYNNLVDVLGGDGEQTAIVYNVIDVLYEMSDMPDNIPSYFNSFKNQITNLGSWLSTMRNQPLELDYIVVSEPSCDVGKGKAGVFKSIAHHVSMFVASFFSESNAIGATSEQDFEETVSIWATTGKERADIKQRLIERSFINQYQIGVDIFLVPGGALLPSLLAGKGPDIVMGLAAQSIIDYASRNALVALNGFESFTLEDAQEGYQNVPGFEEVKTWFYPSAFSSITLEVYVDESAPEKGTVNNVYGLPEKQSYSLLFYREDVLNDLGIEPPKTWDEAYDMIAVLKKRYMDFAPPDFTTILYQNGGTLWRDGMQRTNLDSEVAIQSFITATDYYITYNCPKSYDFQNRFRFSEMPIGMQDITFYSALSIAAPEIKGTWTFTTVPGMIAKDENGNVVTNEDGTPVVNTTTPSSVSSISLLQKGISQGEKHSNACWAWMQWWVSEDAQYNYGIELESSLGIAARYNTANIAALQRLPWSSEELAVLNEQWKNCVGREEAVGDYYYNRYYGFAYNSVINEYEEPRATLLQYIQEINKEVKFKRQQLGLPYTDEILNDVSSSKTSN